MQPVITWPYFLRRGITGNVAHGLCAMAAVSWVMEREHDDHPECACPVIGWYVIGLNDAMQDEDRQRLLSYLPRIAGSRSNDHEKLRGQIIARGAVRVLAPAALESLHLQDQARKLRDLSPDCTMPEAVRAALGISLRKTGGIAEDVKNCAAWAADAAGGLKCEAQMAAKWSAKVAALADSWDEALAILDEALNAGPQGEGWTEEMVESAAALYRSHGGRVEP